MALAELVAPLDDFVVYAGPWGDAPGARSVSRGHGEPEAAVETIGGGDAAAPALGRSVGAYTERPVPGSLRRLFSCAWFHTVPSGPRQPVIVPPDGAMDLIWINGELRVAGPDRLAAVEWVPPGTTVVGLRFRPAAARAWLGAPLSAIVGARVPLEQVRGAEARRLADWLAEAPDPPEVARRLEHALARTATAPPEDEAMARLFALLRQPDRAGGGVVAELERRLGLDARTLRRRCSDAFGYGPKTLDRILRLQRFLTAAAEPRPLQLPLAALAAAVGYADQAHLGRDVRALVGLTPAVVVRQLRRRLADPF
jgi:AraC-like DNA-binding protein